MSAIRTRLLAAAALCGALAPTATCWAQAYGAQAVVDHNDLRWFEPVELDLDGQVPRRDKGFYGSVDKIFWWADTPRIEIGHPGLEVDSERIFPATPLPTALLALEQLEGVPFINSAQDALASSGLQFAVIDQGVLFDDKGNSVQRDDQEFVLGLNTPQPGAGITVGNVLEFAFRDTGDSTTNSGFGRTVATGIMDDPATVGVDESVRQVTTIESVQDFTDAVRQLEQGFVVRNADGSDAGVGFFTADQLVEGDNAVIGLAGELRPVAVRNGIQDALPDAGFDFGERYEFGYSDGERGWRFTVLAGLEATAGATYGVGQGAPFFSQSEQDFFGPDPFFLGDLVDDGLDGIGDGDGEQGAVDIFAFGFGSVPVNFKLPDPNFLAGFRDFNNDNSPFTTSGPILFVGNVGATFTELIVTEIGLPGGGSFDLGPIGTAAGDFLSDVPGAVGAIDTTAIDAALIDIFASGDAGLIAGATAVQDAVAAINGMIGMPGVDVDTGPLSAALATLAAAATPDVDGFQNVLPNNTFREADDLNGNGSNGVITVVADVNGTPTVVGQILDFGDVFNFNVFFDEVTVTNRTEIDGVEFMRTHELSTRHRLQQGRWDNVELSYGVRFLGIDDDFSFLGTGSILGRTGVDTQVENQIVGPQLGLKWTRNDGPWSFLLEGRGTLGYNIVDVDQVGNFGEELIPGALNRPANARLTTSVDSRRFQEFSPLAELRMQLRYRLAKSVTLQAGYTANFITNVHRGGTATEFAAPNFGVLDTSEHIFVNGGNVGVEFRY